MFFVGILSSIIPYIATIAVMCVCFIAGQSSDVQMDDIIEFSDKNTVIEYNVKNLQQAEQSTFTYNSIVSLAHHNKTQEFSASILVPKIIWLCPPIIYCSTTSIADSNKAPPYSI